MFRILLLATILSILNLTVCAQRMENLSSFRGTSSDRYLRLHYDNDYFTKTDQYYSQGVTLEYVAPRIRKFPLSRLLVTPYGTNANAKYGMTLNIFGFTPTSIKSDSILHGDRPFDANMSFQVFSMQLDPVGHQKFSSALSLGIMGRYAFGYDIQYGIHKWTGNTLPKGWQYQIRTDVIVNYQVNYEKSLVAGKGFLLNATGEARIGTLNDKVNAGLNMMAGRFQERYELPTQSPRKTEYYFFLQARSNLVGYDASMQGGLFNRTNPYTISARDLNRQVFQADVGFILNFRSIFLSYTQSYITKEFKTGTYHRWGGVSLGVAL